MELAGYVVNAVVLEGRSVREVAQAHGVSKTWLYELLARHRHGGEEGLTPRSKRPLSSPRRLSSELEEEVVALRKSLAEQGLDAGAHTIAYHLLARRPAARAQVPSVSTIWRVLARRGFVVPQPQKRPRCSFVRFCAELPNECWQADTTHWALADGSDVEVLNFVDDHSRYLVASRAFRTTKGLDVVDVFQSAAEELGVPASVLTDNGAIFNSETRRGKGALETLLAALGATYKHSRPYHPQTCGKVERFHQTLKRWLAKQPGAETLDQLQAQLDWFRAYYNKTRPHRAWAGAPQRRPTALGPRRPPRPPPSPSATTACAGTAWTRRAR